MRENYRTEFGMYALAQQSCLTCIMALPMYWNRNLAAELWLLPLQVVVGEGGLLGQTAPAAPAASAASGAQGVSGALLVNLIASWFVQVIIDGLISQLDMADWPVIRHLLIFNSIV